MGQLLDLCEAKFSRIYWPLMSPSASHTPEVLARLAEISIELADLEQLLKEGWRDQVVAGVASLFHPDPKACLPLVAAQCCIKRGYTKKGVLSKEQCDLPVMAFKTAIDQTFFQSSKGDQDLETCSISRRTWPPTVNASPLCPGLLACGLEFKIKLRRFIEHRFKGTPKMARISLLF